MRVIAGDVGGTNIRLAIFSSEESLSESFYEIVYPSADFNSLEEVLHAFLTENNQKFDAAAFVLAGPVFDEEVTITNLGWTTTQANIRKILGDIPVGFYNDLEGISNFIPISSPTDLVELNPGEHEKKAAIAVIAPGTGLGVGYLIWTGDSYHAQPSEGGHTSFSPTTDMQVDLLRFMQQRYSHVSFERVCSGSAIPEIYEFIKTREDYSEPEWLEKKLRKAAEQTPIIITAATDQDNPIEICQQTVRLFTEILAVEASNMALNLLAFGGVFLAGGLPKYILPYLEESFMEQFTAKGRFSELLAEIPVYVVVHPQPGLVGSARFAFELLGVEIK